VVKAGKAMGWKPSNLPFNTIVFDELTKAKNPQSKRIKAIRPIADAVERVWGLTGTPAPNGLLDVWGQVRVVDKGERLGRSYHQFRQRYFYPEDYRQYKWIAHKHTEDEIHQKVADIALVMRTSEWLDMPDLDVIDHDVTLGRDDRRAYDTLKKDSLIAYGNREVTGVTAAVLINKLLQFTGGAVYSDEGETIPTSNAKFAALGSLFRDHIKSPALVLVGYRHHYYAARMGCPEGAEMFDGSTDQLDRWNAGKIPALVANPASVGHGLNLQRGGQDVVWFDLTWSQELYEQTNARLWRQGQTGAVRVHRLLVADSVDDRVAEVLRRKDKGQSALLAAVEML
jgi:SNF2 family DNA or RNA helicase